MTYKLVLNLGGNSSERAQISPPIDSQQTRDVMKRNTLNNRYVKKRKLGDESGRTFIVFKQFSHNLRLYSKFLQQRIKLVLTVSSDYFMHN